MNAILKIQFILRFSIFIWKLLRPHVFKQARVRTVMRSNLALARYYLLQRIET